jgi:hypothetical protein
MNEVKGEQGLPWRIWGDGGCPRQPIILPAGPIFLRDRAVIAQALLERRIPSIAAFRENMEAGALISYGFDLMGLFYDIASYVQRLQHARDNLNRQNGGQDRPGDMNGVAERDEETSPHDLW